MYGLSIKVMPTGSGLGRFPRIYLAIPCLTEFSFRQSPKGASNGLVGHPALLLVRTGSLDPTTAQMTQWIPLHDFIHSKCTYEL
jgi:hypothetical protein